MLGKGTEGNEKGRYIIVRRIKEMGVSIENIKISETLIKRRVQYHAIKCTKNLTNAQPKSDCLQPEKSNSK